METKAPAGIDMQGGTPGGPQRFATTTSESTEPFLIFPKGQDRTGVCVPQLNERIRSLPYFLLVGNKERGTSGG